MLGLIGFLTFPGLFSRINPSLLLEVAAGLIVFDIVMVLEWRFRRRSSPTSEFKLNIFFSALVIVIVLIAVASYVRLDYVEVPHIDNEELADAERLLSERGLFPYVIPVTSPTTDIGKVVSGSQEPKAGLRMPRGIQVQFKVSDEGSNSLDAPKSDSTTDCVMKPDRVCVITAEGKASKEVDQGNLAVILWSRTTSSAWYLQFPDTRKPKPHNNPGRWSYEAEIGNPTYPPSEGTVVSLVVTVVSRETAAGLEQEKGKGLPTYEGIQVGYAENVSIKRREVP